MVRCLRFRCHRATRCEILVLVPLLLWTLAGAGAVRGQSPYPLPGVIESPGGPSRVAAGDFNSDGMIDLVTNAPGVGRIAFLFGRGGLVFSSRITVNVEGRAEALAVADMDRDGIEDVVWCDGRQGVVGVLTTRGANPVSFVPARVPGGDEASDVAVYDRDGDGFLDVLVAYRGSDEIRWYRNEGGALVPWETIGVGDGPTRLLVIDHPGAGPTVAVAQTGYLARDTVLLGTGDRAPSISFDLVAPGAVDRADLDDDGAPELLLSDAGDGSVRILRFGAAGWTETTRLQGEIGTRTARPLASATSGHRLLAAETDRHRLRLWSDATGEFATLGSWYSGADVAQFLVRDLDGNGSEEIVVPLPGEDRLRVIQPAGEGLLAPSAVLTAALPVRLETDPSGTRLAVLGQLGPRAWVYRLVGSGLELDAQVALPAQSVEVALADLDGVEESDLLVLSGSTGVWRALSLPGDGFAAPQLVAPVSGSKDFEVVDVVGDAALDLVVADPLLPGVRIFEGDGTGGFTEVGSRQTPEIVFTIRHRDLDLDGFEDLVALGEVDDLAILFGGPAGPSAPVVLTVGPSPRDMVFGRFNADAYPDMVCGSAGFSSFSVINSVSEGIYSVLSRNVETRYGSQNCVTIDANSDGFDDVVFSSPTSTSMALHLATGDPELGTFLPLPIEIQGTVSPFDLRAVQLDGDGVEDLLVLDHVAALVTVIRSDPLADLATVNATIVARWVEETVELEVFADARQTNEIELRRETDARPLSLEALGPGRWFAADPDPPSPNPVYVVSDRRGRELDRVEVARARESTASTDRPGPIVLPPRLSSQGAEVRFRVGGNRPPRVRVYDLRGRLVAEPEVDPRGDGWYRVLWTGRDHAGRSAARGRYLVRVEGDGRSLVTPVTLR